MTTTLDPSYERDFSPGFLRKVLALGVRAGLHRRAPGALLPAHFAGLAAGDQRNASPRQRLAMLLERHAAEDPSGWPGAETMDLLVDREAARMRPDEAAALRAEWAAVRDVSVTDAAFVEGEVREWAARLGLQRALLQAADLYQAGATAAEMRAQLLRSVREADPSPDGVLARLAEGYAERATAWERGEPPGSRVPTGLGPLDAAIGGGVRLGESFYALAPPKGAKTTFLTNVALNASRRHFGAALFSYEMGVEAMLRRMDRNVARATKAELRADADPMRRAYAGFTAAGAGDVFVWCGPPPSGGACAHAQRMVEDLRREGRVIDLVCFDFLNIMEPPGEADEKRHALARIGREISAAARALNVAVWSAALVKRTSIAKPRLRKDDIAEVFEMIAVADGIIGVCAPEELVLQGMRSLWKTALRDEGDEGPAGVYDVDLDRMTFYQAQHPPDKKEGGTA